MKDLILYLAQSLVDNKESVSLDVNDDTKTILIKVTKDEIGKVIGKQGRIARAIRIIAKASSQKSGERYTIDIVEA